MIEASQPANGNVWRWLLGAAFGVAVGLGLLWTNSMTARTEKLDIKVETRYDILRQEIDAIKVVLALRGERLAGVEKEILDARRRMDKSPY